VSFDRLLPHFCTIQFPGEEKVGEDGWGRPITKPKEPFQSRCRFVEETIRNRDNTGSDVVRSLYILVPKTTEIDPEMDILNIVDDEGKSITTAKLEVDRIIRQTGRKKLHHHKIYLKGAE
jgi:hypothetical protein